MDHNTKKTTWVRPEAKAEPPQTPSRPTPTEQAQQACCLGAQRVLLTALSYAASMSCLYFEFRAWGAAAGCMTLHGRSLI